MVPYIEIDIFSSSSSVLAKNVRCIADTGAVKSVFPSGLFSRDSIREAKRQKKRYGLGQVESADGSKIRCDGILRVKLQVINKPELITTDILLCPGIEEPLISCKDLVSLRILSPNFPLRNVKCNPLKLDDVLSKYPKVFDDTILEPMDFPPVKLVMESGSDVRPFHINTARKYPIHLEKQAKAELTRLEKLGIIERVTKPTSWCAPSFFLLKENGDVRLITDFSKLSKHIKRPVHPFPTSMDCIQRIKHNHKWFATIDARQSFFQIELDEESRDLTTFLTPDGRYRYARIPMGMSPSSDIWCLASDLALENIENTSKLVDDVLLSAETEAELLALLDKVLKRFDEKKIKCTKRKIQFGKSVKFGGFLLSKEGAKPDPSKLAAISKFAEPKNLTDLRSFLGLAQQLSIGIPDLSHAALGLRELLKKDVAFVWTPVQQESFEKVKEIILSDRVVGFFNPKSPIEVFVDASRTGLGFCLTQRKPDGNLRLIQCGSRSLLDAEKRYAVTELEMLGLYFAVKSCRHYLLHAPDVTIWTDHKSIPGIMTKDLTSLDNNRLIRIREKLLPYRFKCLWIEGKKNILSDCLSRQPCFEPSEQDAIEAKELAYSAYSLKLFYISEPTVDPILKKLKSFASRDKTYQYLKNKLKSEFPKRSLTPNMPIWKFRSHYENLRVECDLVFLGDRLVIPSLYVPTILSQLHLGHSGKTKTMQLARQNFYWLNMQADVHNMIDKCEQCTYFLPSKPKTIDNFNMDVATEPMEVIGLDLFYANSKDYLLICDAFSAFFWVFRLTKTHTKAILRCLSEVLYRFGFCKILCSDQGPQFRTEFDEFCIAHDIFHRLSSPYNAKSNGLSENSVKRSKYLLLKTSMEHEDFDKHLLAYFNTPLQGRNASPAELFFKRKLRMPGMPFMPISRVPSHRKNVPEFKVSDFVSIQNEKSKRWDNVGVVIGIRRSNKSYNIELKDGRIIMRNERFLRLKKS